MGRRETHGLTRPVTPRNRAHWYTGVQEKKSWGQSRTSHKGVDGATLWRCVILGDVVKVNGKQPVGRAHAKGGLEVGKGGEAKKEVPYKDNGT
jgi:hypothetical protein